MEAVSFKESLKTLPRLFTGFSIRDGMVSPAIENLNLSSTFPFFKINDLDLEGLKLILAHAICFSKPRKIHLHPVTDDVVTVRSSI